MKLYYEGRTISGLKMLVELVGFELINDTIETMTVEQLHELEVWAERVHLKASDNPVRLPKRPEWLPEPWRGPEKAANADTSLWGPSLTLIPPLPPNWDQGTPKATPEKR